jgi:hypothetical protein
LNLLFQQLLEIDMFVEEGMSLDLLCSIHAKTICEITSQKTSQDTSGLIGELGAEQ